MSTIEHLDAPIPERPSPSAVTDLPGHKDEAIALPSRRGQLVFLGNAVPVGPAS